MIAFFLSKVPKILINMLGLKSSSDRMSTQQSSRFIVALAIFFTCLSQSHAFRCYIGSSDDPDNIVTRYYLDELDTDTRCTRYQEPTCTGCILNQTEPHRQCWNGCDEESIKNATWTWIYDATSAGVCSDIRETWEQWTFYKDVICCHTDLCNAPINSAVGYSASILTTLLVSLSLMLIV